MNKFLEQAYHIKTNPIIMSQAILDKVSVPSTKVSDPTHFSFYSCGFGSGSAIL